MKRFSLFVILLGFTVSGYAQLFLDNDSMNTLLTERYTLSFNQVSFEQLSQKTMKSPSSDYKVTLTKCDHNWRFIIAKTCYNTNSNCNIYYFDLPNNYIVNDFDVLADTLIFCGQRQIDMEPYVENYIAYKNIDSLLYVDTNINFSLSLLDVMKLNNDSIFDIRKIKAYRDNQGKIIVAGIGSMCYGEPKTSTSTMQLDGSILIQWNVPTKYYYDYFVQYKITESQESMIGYYPNIVNVPVEKSNQVYFFRNTPPNNLIAFDSIERFEDLTITDNYICIISSTYQDSTQFYNKAPLYKYTNAFIVRAIDKNNINNQKSFISDTVSIEEYPSYGCKITNLYADKIAIAYPSVLNNTTVANIHKIDISTDNFVVEKSFDILDNVFNYNKVLLDIKYYAQDSTLLLLKNARDFSNYWAYLNKVTFLNMRDSVTHNYNAKQEYTIHNNLIQDDKRPYMWNDILLIDTNHYVLTGSVDGKLKYLDRYYNSNNFSCVSVSYVPIGIGCSRSLFNFNNLTKCRFGCQVPITLNNPMGFSSRDMHASKVKKVVLPTTIQIETIIQDCQSNQ